jgi:hypothetical protein
MILRDAILELAELFELGALQADTEPVAFLVRVKDEITRLRAIEHEAKELLHALPGYHPELHEAIYGPEDDDE